MELFENIEASEDKVAVSGEVPNHGRILIVDDEIDVTALLFDFLLENGYQAVRYSSGQDALQALREQDFDLLLADLKMPEMNGVELLKAALKIDPLLVGIIITGHGTIQTAVEALKVGAFDYMLKPLKSKELLLTISRAMEIRRLRDSERKYRAIVEDQTELICRFLPGGIITFVNEPYCRYFGKKKEDLIGHTLIPFILKEDQQFVLQTFATLNVENPVATIEYRVMKSDGEIRWQQWTIRFIFDNKRYIEFISVGRDITELKLAEEALKIKDNAIESSINGITIADMEGHLKYVNKSFLKMWGCEKKEALGKHIAELFQNQEEISKVIEEFNDKRGWIGELKARKKDGALFDIQISTSMVKDEAGNPMCMMASFTDITDRKYAEERVQHQLQRITALRNIDMAITASLDLRLTLNIFLDQVATQLRVDAATVLLFNPKTINLDYAASLGFHHNALQHTKLRMGEGYAGIAALERRMISIPNLAEVDGFSRSPLFASEGFVSYYAIPLIARGNVSGVLEIFHRTPLSPEQEWLDFLEALAAQASIAIDNAFLFEDLQRSNIELNLAYDATLEGWSRALDYRDRETEGHSQRVTDMTVRIARIAGMSDNELMHVRRGALLHDIGKLGIPDNILFKPGKLNDEESEIMKRHTVIAHELLSPIPYLRPAIDIPYCHHEKWDGTGYPRGLKGENIPLVARIFAVVDVWDALSSDRPYRHAWPKEKVKKYMQEQAGRHFDPKVSEIFLKLIGKQNLSLGKTS